MPVMRCIFSKMGIVNGFVVVELLTSVSLSWYYYYVLELIVSEQYSLSYYNMCRLEYIEIVLWSLLYIKDEWYENKVKGQVSFLCHVLLISLSVILPCFNILNIVVFFSIQHTFYSPIKCLCYILQQQECFLVKNDSK